MSWRYRGNRLPPKFSVSQHNLYRNTFVDKWQGNTLNFNILKA